MPELLQLNKHLPFLQVVLLESSPHEPSCVISHGLMRVPGWGAAEGLESLAAGREVISCMSRTSAGELCLGKRPGTLEGWESCGNTGATMCTGEAADRKKTHHDADPNAHAQTHTNVLVYCIHNVSIECIIQVSV